MALYAYKKNKNTKRTNLLNSASKIFIICGGILMFWAIYPLISYEVYSRLFIKTNNSSSTSLVNKDLTKASLWFPTLKTKNVNTNLNIKSYKLSIPKLNIENAKVNVGGDDLKKSLIQFIPTSLPGENGNVVILGHSTLPQLYNTKDYKTIFTYLPSLKEGDEIIINLGEQAFKYKVFEMFVVKPDKVSVLDQRFDDSYLTLITCVPPGTYWNRLIVRAKLSKIDNF